MKIKIIDLLNKIANGEEVPKKIKFEKDIFVYDKKRKDYIHKIDNDGWASETLLFRVMCCHFFTEILDTIVEIIEDEDINIQDINIQDIEELDIIMDYEDINIYSIVDNNREKINELIKAVKKLDKEINNE